MALRYRIIFDGDSKGLNSAAKKASGSIDGVKNTAKRAAGAMAASFGAVMSIKKIIDATKQYQRLFAQLKSSTGNAKIAADAMAALRDFSQETGQDLESVVQGFNKLVNLGLNPSREALEAYANVAAATGKTTQDFIEAVADAATAEFERLKEFGIKARNEGDTVKFTFRGVTTSVKNDSASIEKYLMKLGKVEFAGTIAEQSKTLEAEMTKLKNSWDRSLAELSSGTGISDAFTASIKTIRQGLDELTAFFASGQATASFKAWAESFTTIIKGVGDDATKISKKYSTEINGILHAASASFDFVINAIKQLPTNIIAITKILTIELASWDSIAKAYMSAFVKVIKVKFTSLINKVGIYAKELKDKLDIFDGDTFDFAAEIAKENKRAAKEIDGHYKKAEQTANAAKKARLSMISTILTERDAALKSYDAQIKAADKLRQTYDNKLAKQKNTDLGQFSKATGGQDGKPAEPSKGLAKLQDDLRTAEERLLDSYNRRRDIILNNTQNNEILRQDLLKRLNQQFKDDLLQGYGDDPFSQPIEDQIARINEEFEAKRQAILQNTALTEQQRTALEIELTKRRNDQVKQLETQKISMQMQNYNKLFNGLAGLAKAFGGEQSKTYKAMFAISKAFAIADSIVKIQQGIANAAALPFPINIPAMATVAAQTVGIISTIKGATFKGQAHDGIGKVPAANEGTWMLKRGEMVLNPRQRENFEFLVNHIKKTGETSTTTKTISITNEFNFAGGSNTDEAVIMTAVEIATEKMKQDLYNDFDSNGELAQRLRSA
jgi:hypothetical protein